MKGHLPTELVQQILLCLTTDDTIEASGKSACLRSLCLASHAFCQLAAPHLYHTVVLPDPRKAHIFFASTPAYDGLRLHLKHLWCGIVSQVLYDAPHTLACNVRLSAKEVAWMQADSDGRYHGFHYSTCLPPQKKESLMDSRQTSPIDPSLITALHVVCPDLGRWALPLFSYMSNVRYVTLSLYPSGNWDLEEAKLERVLRGILTACTQLESLQIIVGHTVAAAGSRMVRMTRSIPVAHAVRAVDDDRINVKAADFLFGIHGRSPAEEVVRYTRLLWDERVSGQAGPWPAAVR